MTLRTTLRQMATCAALAPLCGCSDDLKLDASSIARRDAGLEAGAMPTGARAPDLRFKWVGSEFIQSDLHASRNFSVGAAASNRDVSFQAPTPMQLPVLAAHGGDDEADAGVAAALRRDVRNYGAFTPTPRVELLRMLDKGDRLSRLDGDLVELFAQNQVVSSLDVSDDLGEDGSRGYGLLAVTPDSLTPRYAAVSINLARDALADWVANQGAQSRVVTAIAGTGSGLRVIAYGRDGDRDTYETTIGELAIDAQEDLARFEDRARDLSMQGYIITAVGRDGHTLLLVGTRKANELAPRALSDSTERAPNLQHGGAIVAWLNRGDATLALIEQ